MLFRSGQQIGGSIGTSLLNTLAASATAGYVTSHISPATLVHGRPSPQLVSLALVHGYHTGFLWAAVIFAVGAVVCGTLLRWGPLTSPAGPAGAAAGDASTAAAGEPPMVHL